MHLSVALDGAGWHPAAWREPRARPGELFTGGYWADVIKEAERGLLDFVTIEDGLGLQSSRRYQPDQRTDQVRGRLDAVLIAARTGPLTCGIGLVPTAVVTHTEPFHISKAIATLDYVTAGRAGLRVQVTPRPGDAAHFGRRSFPGPAGPADAAGGAGGAGTADGPGTAAGARQAAAAVTDDLFDEAGDYVEVVRRLWDSWEDDAEIRDAATGRFIDRDKLHYIDFHGRFFSVRGPSITPRPPQGQPLVTALGHAAVPCRLIGRSADVGFVTPRDPGSAREIVGQIRAVQQAASRAEQSVHVFGDLVVFLDQASATGADRKARLDEHAGQEYASDAAIFAGSPEQLADLLLGWEEAGLSGFRLRPGVIPDDLEAIARGLVPELQRRGKFRRRYESPTLRGLLGLPRPASRYVTT